MFRILCHRSSTSTFGAATAYAKESDGAGGYKIMEFETREAAQARVTEWNNAVRSPNVRYSVEDMDA